VFVCLHGNTPSYKFTITFFRTVRTFCLDWSSWRVENNISINARCVHIVPYRLVDYSSICCILLSVDCCRRVEENIEAKENALVVVVCDGKKAF